MGKSNKNAGAAKNQENDTNTSTNEKAAEKKIDSKDDAVSKLEAENKELNDKLLRSFAEFDNYKRRTAKEKEEIGSFVKGQCLKDILAVVDNFERALSSECKDDDFKKGIDMIFAQLKDTLRSQGVEEIEAEGKTFDPELHNAVNHLEDESYGENTICQVFQKGYTLNGKVIRHSMVVVANP